MLYIQIREARKQHGLSQSELARRADVPRTTIVSFEQGKQNITVDTLRKMLAQLPSLRSVGLGAVEMYAGVDEAAARESLIALITAAARTLSLLGLPALVTPAREQHAEEPQVSNQ